MISCTMLGYKIVSVNEKVDEIEEKIDNQKSQEKYITPYGYTLENPNIIKNPYGDSPRVLQLLNFLMLFNAFYYKAFILSSFYRFWVVYLMLPVV